MRAKVVEPRKISLTDTAKLVRHTLNVACPDVTFKVRSNNNPRLPSIDVSWTDGPMWATVERLVLPFAAQRPSGEPDDSHYYVNGLLNGEVVRFGADLILCQRYYSDGFYQCLADHLFDVHGGERMIISKNRWGDRIIENGWQMFGETLSSDMLYQLANLTTDATGGQNTKESSQ